MTERIERLLARLSRAAMDFDVAARPDERDTLHADAMRRFADTMTALYAGAALPEGALLRCALTACGAGGTRLIPLEWGRRHFVHQFLTREFVDALAAYLASLGHGPILEVGAGPGDLARHLRDRGLPITATDDGSWLDGRHAWPCGLPADVEPLGYQDALAHHAPAIVLCCWMPLGTDWTPAFRACPSVREYLLIGEGPGGCTASDAAFVAPAGWSRARLPAIDRHGVTRNVDRGGRTSVYRFAREGAAMPEPD